MDLVRAQEVAQPQPSSEPPGLELVFRNLRGLVSRIASSTLENEESFRISKEVLRAIFASCQAYQMQPPGVPPPRPLLVAKLDGVPSFNVPVRQITPLRERKYADA